MRKVVAIEHVTVDGFAASNEGLGFEFTWRGYSAELATWVNEHVRSDVDTTLYGRQTFLGMESFWSDQPPAQPSEPDTWGMTPFRDSDDESPSAREHYEWVNNVEKIVFSTTLQPPTWRNSRLISHDVAAEVEALKAQPGGTMAIFASPKLVHSFIEMGLIDEFRLMVHPVTLGAGVPLFHDKSQLELDLIETRSFDTGVVYVNYRVNL